MRVALICPAEDRDRVRRRGDRPRESKILRTNRVSLLAVAAATPDGHEIVYVDEHVEPIDFGMRADVVGVSFPTGLAPRAYEIGDGFRRRGVPVAFGGYHPTFMPDEAMLHCDAVCVGEAEPSWPRMLSDLAGGRMEKVYRANGPCDLAGLGFLRRDIMKSEAYFSTNVVLAGRGCPHACEYCSVTSFFHHQYRCRPVSEVIREIRTLPGGLVLFGDDNLVADRAFALQLFQELEPLGKEWLSQCNLSIGEDTELLALAARSGCRGIFIGFESLSDRNLSQMGKGFYRAEHYAEIVGRIQEAGIAVMGGFVFGFDHDDDEVFDRTIEFVRKQRLVAAQLAILTPFPGTPLFERLDADGRILDRDWSRYDFRHVVFRPRRMSPEALQEGTDRVIDRFYSGRAILGRIGAALPVWGVRRTLLYALPLNIGYRLDLRRSPRARA